MEKGIDKLKCGGKVKKMAKGGSVQEPEKPKQLSEKARQRAQYYIDNIDNPKAYLDDQIFSDPGQVAGLYNDLYWTAGDKSKDYQDKFLKNVDSHSNYIHGMRMSNTSTSKIPGIVANKRLEGIGPIGRDNPEYGMYRSLYVDPLSPNASFEKRFTKEHPGYHNPKDPNYGKGIDVYEFSPKKGEQYRIDKDLWNEKRKEHQVITQKLENGGLVNKEMGALGTTAAELATGISDSAFNAHIKNLQDSQTMATNPGELMTKMNRAEGAKDILGSTLKGAGAGAMFGPAGIAIGAAAGLTKEVVSKLIAKKSNDAAAQSATQDWSAGNAANYLAQGYKEGGKIVGKGGTKTDSINMSAPQGSFIVPAENSPHALRYGRKYLGWSDNSIATRNNGGTDIKVSNGEVYFTPEEVGILGYYGVDLNKLAPNAKPQHKMGKYATGMDGDPEEKTKRASMIKYMVDNDLRRTTTGLKVGNYQDLVTQPKVSGNPDWDANGNPILSYSPEREKLKTTQAMNQPDNTTPYSGLSTKKQGIDWNNVWKNAGDNLGEIAGFAQFLGGAAGLISAGKKPDLSVSHSLQKLSAEVRKRAEFGFEPKVKNELLNQIERTRRDYENSIDARGGSAGDIMAAKLKGLSTVLGAKAQVVYQDAAEKSRKWADKLKVESEKSGQEFEIDKLNLADYFRTQEMWADVASAGIQNTVGARQLKSEQDMMREIADKYGFRFK